MGDSSSTQTDTDSTSPATGDMHIAIVGMGYVGLPLAMTFIEGGVRITGIDVSERVVDGLNAGTSHIDDIASEDVAQVVADGVFTATTDASAVAETDAIIIAVPTPLSRNREPDLSMVADATRTIAPHIQDGQLVVLESTTYPGTTRELVLPILEHGQDPGYGVDKVRTVGEDFYLAYSPERVDPGNPTYTTRNTPKVVGGITEACTQRARELYESAVDHVHTVTTPDAAELTKLLENIFRSVNIALVNELAMLCQRMDIDVWEVVEAAGTKPFGFMSFRPGPGLGGHCIPIDPFYLSWKAREYDFATEFIELAGKINSNMPYYCVQLLEKALSSQAKALRSSKVLIIGLAYKKDISDYRESPSVKVYQLLERAGAEVAYHDPYVPEIGALSNEPTGSSIDLDPETIAAHDAVLILTDHTVVDYEELIDNAQLVVDYRNRLGDVDAAQTDANKEKVWKL